MATIDFKRQKISKKTICEYELYLDGQGYVIECTEYDRNGFVKDFARVRDITNDYREARAIFDKLTRNKACACTLFDIVSDLIC